jgi:hypothetical protein
MAKNIGLISFIKFQTSTFLIKNSSSNTRQKSIKNMRQTSKSYESNLKSQKQTTFNTIQNESNFNSQKRSTFKSNQNESYFKSQKRTTYTSKSVKRKGKREDRQN